MKFTHFIAPASLFLNSALATGDASYFEQAISYLSIGIQTAQEIADGTLPGIAMGLPVTVAYILLNDIEMSYDDIQNKTHSEITPSCRGVFNAFEKVVQLDTQLFPALSALSCLPDMSSERSNLLLVLEVLWYAFKGFGDKFKEICPECKNATETVEKYNFDALSSVLSAYSTNCTTTTTTGQ
ncbi:MAG: hypothetical protein M1834_004198 [Cirrosporium novae-zelandiae]|nr:MAG: hypothetical protein M1834_004198 [Cirrosporium novae-zelandiae]